MVDGVKSKNRTGQRERKRERKKERRNYNLRNPLCTFWGRVISWQLAMRSV